jgi:transcriptional regulator with XRE-family HTH domain
MKTDNGPGPGPVASRWRLRTELRRLREQCGLTQDAVARQLDWSHSKIVRIERGTSKISVRDVHALLRAYGVGEDETVDRLVDWAKRGRRRDWWFEYKKVIPDSYSGYVGLEAEASTIRSFQPTVIPGLLQTAAYIREVVGADSNVIDSAVQDRRVALRLHRQRQVLDKPDPPSLIFVVDEGVLLRVAGSCEINFTISAGWRSCRTSRSTYCRSPLACIRQS